MTEFFVGQKVVYIGTNLIRLRPPEETSAGLVRNAVYTVRWVGETAFRCIDGITTHPALRLVEYTRLFSGRSAIYNDYPTYALAFRPLAPKSTAIFRKIAADATGKRKITVCEPDRLRQSSREVG